MRRSLMGLFGLMVALSLAPGVALAAEGPPAVLDAPTAVVEVVAGEGGETPEPNEAAAGVATEVAALASGMAEPASPEDEGVVPEATEVNAAEAGGSAEGSTVQIMDEGGMAEGSGAGGVEVTVGKTIAPTDVENYFDITLVVEVNEPVEDDSTAVVIVMDVSNTMNDDEAGRAPGEESFTSSRLVNAQTAASEFIRQYCEGEGLSPNRMLGVVTFNTDAQWAEGLGMQVVSVDSIDALQSNVSLITAPGSPSGIRFTNMEAGLLLAKNALDQLDVAHKYVVFLTDGFPTTYVDRSIEGNAEDTESISGYDPYEPGAYQPAQVGSDGYFADAVLDLPCTYGTSYSDKAAERAAEAAQAMKADGGAQGGSGINVFSVGIAIGSQTVQEYVDAATGTFSIVDRTSDSYVIGAADDSAAYESWLAEEIAGGPSFDESVNPYADGDNLEELQAAFEGILDDIRATSGLPLEDAVVTDPMGENVEFQYFFDVAGKPATGLVGQLGISDEGEPFENTAAFDVPADAIKWNLMESGYQVRTDDAGKRIYAFELTYRVRLANEASGFEYGESVATNGTTTLEYATAGEENEPVEFPIPAVKGFDGGFSFVKVDQVSGLPVAGAQFELSHSEDCPACAAAAAASAGLVPRVVVGPFAATSDAQGVVSFAGVPSGHAYVLVETQPAEGYVPTDARFDAGVSYGSTVVVDEDGATVFESGSVENDFRVANEPVEVPPVDPVNPPTPPTPPSPPDTPDVPEAPDAPQQPSSDEPSARSVIPQTGDSAPWRAALALAIVGLVAIALEVLTRKNNRQR